MTKKADFQAFKTALRDVCDRPCMLGPLFDRGLTVEQTKQELLQFRGQPMFKHGRFGQRRDRPHKRVDRILTLDSLQRKAARRWLQTLEGFGDWRMTAGARQWLVETVAAVEAGLRA